MERLLTTEQVADYLQVTVRTVYRWLESKQLVALKAGKEWRIKESDLQEFLEKRSNAEVEVQ